MDFVTDSAEDLCAAMCDNVVPKERPGWWIFTLDKAKNMQDILLKLKEQGLAQEKDV